MHSKSILKTTATQRITSCAAIFTGTLSQEKLAHSSPFVHKTVLLSVSIEAVT